MLSDQYELVFDNLTSFFRHYRFARYHQADSSSSVLSGALQKIHSHSPSHHFCCRGRHLLGWVCVWVGIANQPVRGQEREQRLRRVYNRDDSECICMPPLDLLFVLGHTFLSSEVGFQCLAQVV
jgi:hypothetical protein